LRTGHFIQLILHDTKHKINIYGKPATQGLEISQRTTGIGCTTGIDIVSPFTASLDPRYMGFSHKSVYSTWTYRSWKA
jgi:hypothetical protein